MISLMETAETNWFRFLAHWSLLAGLVVLSLLLLFFILLFPVVQNSPLPDQYNDLLSIA